MFGLQGHSRKAEHNFCRDNLSAFIDGQLADHERERVSRHLEQCEACRDDMQSLQRTVELLRALPRVRAPRSFQIPVNAPAPALPFWMRPWAYNAGRVASAAAAVFLVIALAGNALLLSGGVPVAQGSPLAAVRSENQAGPAPNAEVLQSAPEGGAVSAEAPQAAPAPTSQAEDAYGEPSTTAPATLGASDLSEQPTLTAGEAAMATAAPKGMGGGAPAEPTLNADAVAAGRGVVETSPTPEPGVAALAAEPPPAPAPGGTEGSERMGATSAEPGLPTDGAAPVSTSSGLWQARERLSGYPWGWWALASGLLFAALLATTLWMRARLLQLSPKQGPVPG